MPRIQFSDVVPPEKRSIRNVSIPTNSRRTKVISQKQNDKVIPSSDIESSIQPTANKQEYELHPQNNTKPDNYYYEKNVYSENSRKKKYLYVGIFFVALIGFITTIMTVFASAKITVKPKRESVSISIPIQASTTSLATTTRYELLKLTKLETIEVEATGEEMVEKKASGKITIFNNFSKDPQRLITRTRFETKSGLIYRIAESIVVPGKTSSGPGFIDVEIFADEPGEKYNSKEKIDFSIPGFKNDKDRFINFYAKSSGEISGGFIGKIKKVDENVKKDAFLKIESGLKEKISKELETQIPSELVLLENAIVYDFKEIVQKDTKDKAIIGKEATAYAVLLDKVSLQNNILQKYLINIDSWQNIDAEIEQFDNLKITKEPNLKDNSTVIDLNIEGDANIIAKINESSISEVLAGKKRSEISNILQKFKGIDSVIASIKPMWKKSLPSDQSKIYIDIE